MFIKGVQCHIVPLFVTGDLVPLQIKIGESGDQKDVICTAYFPSNSGTPSPPKEFKEVIGYYVERKLELLTGCDANAHHTVWSSSDVNSKGEDLCEYLMAQELLILNKGKAPTFVYPEKTEGLLFTRKRKTEGVVRPEYEGVKLNLTKEVKYLSVILDDKLTWKAHVRAQVKKGLKALWSCNA